MIPSIVTPGSYNPTELHPTYIAYLYNIEKPCGQVGAWTMCTKNKGNKQRMNQLPWLDHIAVTHTCYTASFSFNKVVFQKKLGVVRDQSVGWLVHAYDAINKCELVEKVCHLLNHLKLSHLT